MNKNIKSLIDKIKEKKGVNHINSYNLNFDKKYYVEYDINKNINKYKNILIIAKIDLFSNQVSTNRLHFLNFLKEKSNIIVLNDDKNIDLNDWLKNNTYPDVIIYYFLSWQPIWHNIDIKNFNNNDIKKYMIMEDCFYQDIAYTLYNKYNFKLLLMPTINNEMKTFFANKKMHFTLFDYSIDTNIFKKNLSLKKEYDVLFYGAHWQSFYPLRENIYHVLKLIQKNTNYKIKIIENNADYDNRTNKLPTDKNLVDLICKSRFAISTGGIHKLLYKKYMEISLCETTIIGNIPENYNYVFENRIINIDFNETKENIYKIIIDCLENKYVNIEKNSYKLQKYFKKNNNFEHGYKKMCLICEKNDNFDLSIEEYIKYNNITHLYCSYSLNIFKDRFEKKYKLETYNKDLDKNKNTLFFGIYCNYDTQIINNHKQNLIHLIFGGTDVDMHNYINLNNKKEYNYLSISNNIYERLKNKDICFKDNIHVKNIAYFNLIDHDVFKPSKKKGTKIYIYNGNSKNFGERYGESIYKEVVKKLPEFTYIYSCDLNVDYKKMPDIYSDCFIGLRLTMADGNANTVQEFEAMNIPIVHNQSDYGLKWKNIDDIVNYIIRYKN